MMPIPPTSMKKHRKRSRKKKKGMTTISGNMRDSFCRNTDRGKPEEDGTVTWQAVSKAEEERMIRQLATFSPVSVEDVMELLKLPEERAENLCQQMVSKGSLRNCGGRYEAVQ